MPGTISFDGLATGINTTETVDKLIEVESRPKILKEAEKVRLDNQLTTWQEVNSKLLDLRTQAQDLWKPTAWNTLTASSSSESTLTATTSSSAGGGTYTVEVNQLARNHQMASKVYTSELDTVGEGTLTLEVNAESTPIDIDSTNNTLTGVANAINRADAGVTASIINDGSGYRILLTSDESGEDYAIGLTGDAGDALDATTIQTAQDAEIELGSGAGAITINNSSNEMEGVIDGVTLNLVSASPGTSITLSLTRDTTAVEEQIGTFVEAYNTALSYVSEQFTFNTETSQGGILMGNRTLLAIQSRIQNLMGNAVETGGSFTALRSIGLEVEDDGTLAFDGDTFGTAVETDYAAVEAMFRTTGRTDHSKISFVYAGGDAAEPSSDGYEVEITRAAERASVEAGADVTTLTIDATNDTLTLALDAGSTFNVTLAQDTYASIEALAEEIQAKINAASPDDEEVTVTAGGDSRLTLTSQRYGSSSTVQLLGGDGVVNLGFTVGDEDTGVDVAGTINGESATGTGQYLRGDDDNDADGVQLRVELTPDDVTTPGGAVETQLYFAKGIGARLNEYLQGLTMPLVGVIGMKQTALETSIRTIQERIEEMDDRLAQRRESMLEQFYRMEKAVNEMNSQGNYLANALSGLSKNWQFG